MKSLLHKLKSLFVKTTSPSSLLRAMLLPIRLAWALAKMVLSSVTKITVATIAIMFVSFVWNYGLPLFNMIMEEMVDKAVTDTAPRNNPAFILNDARLRGKDGEHNPIIRLKNLDGVFYCSAFVVSNEYAITASHCIMSKMDLLERIPFRVFDDKNKDTNVLAMPLTKAARMDVAILRGNFKNFKKVVMPGPSQEYAMVTSTSPGPWISCGYPFDAELTCFPVSGLHQVDFFLAGGGQVYPGMSGGPLVDTSTNVVIGLNSASVGPDRYFTPLIAVFQSAGIQIKEER